MGFRIGVLLLVGLLVLGCGAATRNDGGASDELQPAPSIEAIDEPASARFFFPPEFSKDGTPVRVEVCRFIAEKSGAADSSEGCEPTQEHLADFTRAAWEDRPELAPPDASKLRSVARLQLEDRGPNDRATLAVWRSPSRALCLTTDIEDADGLQGGTAFGPCLVGSRCTDVCLDRSGHYDYDTPPWLLSGVVSANADEFRIVLADGRSVRYPLTGPVVPGFRQWRVFMVDLGRRSHSRLELLAAGKVVAHRDEWPRQVATDHCVLTHEWPEQERAFDECMGKAWAEGVSGN